ncbi:DNA mismatch repair protein MutL [Actinoplanes sp. NEAU-A12]|uniref:DNA mismatch repair protein MutL n=1 Tax=Actinoplanes sandaracinus TaxID=3045177 RepID=A0ABT6WTX7_9ACTN|nr:DNA mismatch repair protein MutL [Actinoplanes sandaracinus]MDI6103101.1 DNA mismatch repair protein MutL [Actinoplanes sandaracinus]
MRSSRWVPIAGWCVATATSIVLSSVALSPVLNAAQADSGELPDIDQLPAAAALSGTSGAPTPKTATPSPIASPSTSATPSRTTPSASRSAATSPEPAATTTKPSTTTENGWTVTTSDGVKTYVRSFATAGGTAVVKMTSKGIVSLVTATPADGFRVEKTGSDTNLVVYFHETGRSFIIHAQWWNDAPLVEVNQIGA